MKLSLILIFGLVGAVICEDDLQTSESGTYAVTSDSRHGKSALQDANIAEQSYSSDGYGAKYVQEPVKVYQTGYGEESSKSSSSSYSSSSSAHSSSGYSKSVGYAPEKVTYESSYVPDSYANTQSYGYAPIRASYETNGNREDSIVEKEEAKEASSGYQNSHSYSDGNSRVSFSFGAPKNGDAKEEVKVVKPVQTSYVTEGYAGPATGYQQQGYAYGQPIQTEYIKTTSYESAPKFTYGQKNSYSSDGGSSKSSGYSSSSQSGGSKYVHTTYQEPAQLSYGYAQTSGYEAPVVNTYGSVQEHTERYKKPAKLTYSSGFNYENEEAVKSKEESKSGYKQTVSYEAPVSYGYSKPSSYKAPAKVETHEPAKVTHEYYRGSGYNSAAKSKTATKQVAKEIFVEETPAKKSHGYTTSYKTPAKAVLYESNGGYEHTKAYKAPVKVSRGYIKATNYKTPARVIHSGANSGYSSGGSYNSQSYGNANVYNSGNNYEQVVYNAPAKSSYESSNAYGTQNSKKQSSVSYIAPEKATYSSGDSYKQGVSYEAPAKKGPGHSTSYFTLGSSKQESESGHGQENSYNSGNNYKQVVYSAPEKTSYGTGSYDGSKSHVSQNNKKKSSVTYVAPAKTSYSNGDGYEQAVSYEAPAKKGPGYSTGYFNLGSNNQESNSQHSQENSYNSGSHYKQPAVYVTPAKTSYESGNTYGTQNTKKQSSVSYVAPKKTIYSSGDSYNQGISYEAPAKKGPGHSTSYFKLGSSKQESGSEHSQENSYNSGNNYKQVVYTAPEKTSYGTDSYESSKSHLSQNNKKQSSVTYATPAKTSYGSGYSYGQTASYQAPAKKGPGHSTSYFKLGTGKQESGSEHSQENSYNSGNNYKQVVYTAPEKSSYGTGSYDSSSSYGNQKAQKESSVTYVAPKKTTYKQTVSYEAPAKTSHASSYYATANKNQESGSQYSQGNSYSGGNNYNQAVTYNVPVKTSHVTGYYTSGNKKEENGNQYDGNNYKQIVTYEVPAKTTYESSDTGKDYEHSVTYTSPVKTTYENTETTSYTALAKNNGNSYVRTTGYTRPTTSVYGSSGSYNNGDTYSSSFGNTYGYENRHVPSGYEQSNRYSNGNQYVQTAYVAPSRNNYGDGNYGSGPGYVRIAGHNGKATQLKGDDDSRGDVKILTNNAKDSTVNNGDQKYVYTTSYNTGSGNFRVSRGQSSQKSSGYKTSLRRN